MKMPNDPVILLSLVNTLLRDRYASLEALCEGENINICELTDRLTKINYSYNSDSNQFI